MMLESGEPIVEHFRFYGDDWAVAEEESGRYLVVHVETGFIVFRGKTTPEEPGGT